MWLYSLNEGSLNCWKIVKKKQSKKSDDREGDLSHSKFVDTT